MSRKIIKEIANITGNESLSFDIKKSVSYALKNDSIHLPYQRNLKSIFNGVLSSAIYNIEENPKGRLFRRLLEYGPHHPNEPDTQIGNGQTILSNHECGLCIYFIFSHMVNQFKGDLAELLAWKPCALLTELQQRKGIITNNLEIYFGKTIKAPRRIRKSKKNAATRWDGFALGADGVLVERITNNKCKDKELLVVHGVIEIKSMRKSRNEILSQIDKHIARMQHGIKLCNEIWSSDEIVINKRKLVRIIVRPDNWKLNRDYHFEKSDDGSRRMIFPTSTKPPSNSNIIEINKNTWEIKLSWSHEALEEAAYEMTFWYMSQVGKSIYTDKPMPKGWESMTPEEAGFNAIKMMFYYILLRKLTNRQEYLACKLYNIYCFGYPLGVDSKEMLLPEDFTA